MADRLVDHRVAGPDQLRFGYQLTTVFDFYGSGPRPSPARSGSSRPAPSTRATSARTSAAPMRTGARVAQACARSGSARAGPCATGAQARSFRTATTPMRG
eukprot:2582151-Alexandrium_andersonii.AAC.1